MGQVPTLKNPIFVALDIDNDQQALQLAKNISGFVGGFKVGPRLTFKYGAKFVRELSEIGPVFVDNKYHDIPSTVLSALRTTHESGATFATVHASNGPEALKDIAKLEFELNKIRSFKVLSVTVLTSFNHINLPTNWQEEPPQKHVLLLAEQTIESGIDGLVCSPEEVKILREKFPQSFLVTPGIRLPENSKGDQARVMGPKEAINAGASALVIGRPIVEANDPIDAARKFSELLNAEH